MKKLFLLLLSVLISTQTFAANSALNFGSLGVSGRGMSGSDPVSYTPIFSAAFGTPTNVSFTYSRAGKFLTVNGSFTMGTPGSGVSSISLPVVNGSQLNIDTTATSINTTTSNPSEPIGWCQEGFTAYLNQPMLASTSTSTSVVYVGRSINLTNFTTPASSTQLDSGQVVSVKFTVPIAGWTAGGDGASSAEVAAARHGDDCVFTNADAGGISDFATDASCTFTSRIASGITLSALLDGGSQDYPGVKFTPTVSGAYYEICARTTIQSGGGAGSTVQMYDGSGALMAQSFTQATYTVMPFCGIYLSVGTSEVGFRLRAYTNTGTTTISGLSLNESGIEWIVKRIK